METTRKTIALLAALVLSLGVRAESSPQEKYIRRWAPVAVSEMYRSGVPASITLAQGLLESRYGLSSLASEGNNHFGIKCHNWTGKKMFYDDDAKGECFRSYPTAEESFRDHSDFLRYRDRYKFLFELKTTDYKSWAAGLKKAGYATDPNYASKLVKYIEDYKLYEYDRMTLAQAGAISDSGRDESEWEIKSSAKGGSKAEYRASGRSASEAEGKVSGKSARKAEKKALKEQERIERAVERKEKKSRKAARDEEPVSDVIPDSPLSIESAKPIDRNGLESFSFSLTRQTFSKNGVPFITSVEGETYSSIALSYDLFLKEILKYNDLKREERLLPGTVVYIQPKRSQSAKGLDKYIVEEEGQSLRDICQRFGIKMASVLKMNGLSAGYQPREGDVLLLREKSLRKRLFR